MADKHQVQLRATSNKTKAFAQYEELRRSGRVKASLILAEMHDGNWQILGQQMSPPDMAQALMVGAEGLSQVSERLGADRTALKPEPHEEPLSVGAVLGQSLKTKAIQLDEEGTMIPPYGENFVSCGECHHPRWFVLHTNADNRLTRMACAHCGNEVIQVPVEL